MINHLEAGKIVLGKKSVTIFKNKNTGMLALEVKDGETNVYQNLTARAASNIAFDCFGLETFDAMLDAIKFEEIVI